MKCIQRIQRKRTKGWKMSDNTVYVGRPTKWGNPFRLTSDGWIEVYNFTEREWIYRSETNGFTIMDVLELYEQWITGKLTIWGTLTIPPEVSELKGKNLACWCSLDKPCHADVLIKLIENLKPQNHDRRRNPINFN